MVYLLLFCVVVVGVSVRSFQQINVTKGHYIRIPPTSYAFAAMEILTVVNIAKGEYNMLLMIVVMGTAGWIGNYASMWFSGKLDKRGIK